MLGAMRLRSALVAIAACLLVAACGGSSKSSAPATSTEAATTQATGTGAATAAATTSTQAAATSSGAATTTTTSASAPPEVPKTKTHKGHGGAGGHSDSGGHGGASQGAHVESNLTVSANGDVSPPVVSVPSGVGVELRVTNHGSSAATVALSVPSHPSVKVAPGTRGTLETAGLKDGTYRILVNGTPRGQLLIGAQGGP